MPVQEPLSKDAAASKMQRAFRRHSLIKLNKKIRVDNDIAEYWKVKNPELYEYINWENISKDPQNKLFFSLNMNKVNQLLHVIQNHLWQDEILLNPDLPLYALKAFHDKTIIAHQRTTFIQIYWACREFGRQNVKTYSLFDKDMNFSEEAKLYLNRYFGGELIQIANSQLKKLFENIPTSEQYFTVIDITTYESNRYGYPGSMFTSLMYNEINASIKIEDKIFDPMIHFGALDVFIKFLCNTSFTFYSRLGLFSGKDIADYELEDKRLSDERFPNIKSLFEAHGKINLTAREIGKHDTDYHAVLVAATPTNFRLLMLKTIRQLIDMIIEKFSINDYESAKSIIADMEFQNFYKHRFHGATFPTIEPIINQLFKSYEAFDILAVLLIGYHMQLNPEIWQPFNINISLLKNYNVNVEKLFQITDKIVSKNPKLDLHSNLVYKLVIEALLRYLTNYKYLTTVSGPDVQITHAFVKILKHIPEEHFPKKTKIMSSLQDLISTLGSLYVRGEQKYKAVSKFKENMETYCDNLNYLDAAEENSYCNII